jgi:hypothetical protein
MTAYHKTVIPFPSHAVQEAKEKRRKVLLTVNRNGSSPKEVSHFSIVHQQSKMDNLAIFSRSTIFTPLPKKAHFPPLRG